MSSQLQHTLQQFEAKPPKELWMAIEERLNDDGSDLQKRLLTFEEIPPSGAWQQIEASLSTIDAEAKTVRFNNKWFRYIAAAVTLGLVAISIFNFVIKQPENTLAQQPAPKNQTNSNDATHSTLQQNETSIPGNSNELTNRTIATEKPSTQSGLSNTLASTTTKRYKVIAKEDGKLVRFSQKALAVFDCAVKATANQNVRCKENIKSMQEKMATSIVSPTADFAGLIDMIKTLEENK